LLGRGPLVTTGNAAFCADLSQLDISRPDDLCRFCSQDTDCEEEFGPGSACVVLKGICTPICASTDRTARPAGFGMRTVQAVWFRADPADGPEPDFQAFTQMDVLTIARKLQAS
jgi:hypothetical protein